MYKRLIFWFALLLLLLACNFGITSPTPTTNLRATLAALTPAAGTSNAPTTLQPTFPPQTAGVTPPANATTAAPIAQTLTAVAGTATFAPIAPTAILPTQPTQGTKTAEKPAAGRIVFTCQWFKSAKTSQICMMNADGSGLQRLTHEDQQQYQFPALAPDAKSILFTGAQQKRGTEIYEMNLASGAIQSLTERLGNLGAPEISPDGKWIIFANRSINTNKSVIWLMDRRGKNPDKISRLSGWDPTWMPDSQTVLFVSEVEGEVQLIRSGINGKNVHRHGNLSDLGGRVAVSPDGQWIAAYVGQPGSRQIYLLTGDGLNARVISPPGADAREPAFSPDGQWLVFSANLHLPGDPNGCEIYIMRLDGSALQRLTNNDYCDSQPRWGK